MLFEGSAYTAGEQNATDVFSHGHRMLSIPVRGGLTRLHIVVFSSLLQLPHQDL